MKILQVIPYFNPKFGGDVNVSTNLSNQLAKRNHEVTVITTDYGFDPKYAEFIRSEGVNVISFHCRANLGLFLYSPSIKTWLKKNLKNYDIIHLQNYRSYQNAAVRLYALKLGIPYIVQAHGAVPGFFDKQNSKKLFDWVWGDKILTDASKLIAVSKVERDQFLKIGIPEKKIEIIPNGIDVLEFELLPERGKFRKKYGIGSDIKIILYLGRLHKIKGLDFLINGFSNLLGQYQDIILVIVGSDDGFLNTLIYQIKKLKIDEKVLITGPLFKDEKIEAFVDADVLIYPGILEIFGLVTFEAIMCGTPVIVTDGCGSCEIIEEGRFGDIIKYGDIGGLSKKIKEVLTNPDDTKEKVYRGQQYIKENLSYDIITNRFLKLYDTCRKHEKIQNLQ